MNVNLKELIRLNAKKLCISDVGICKARVFDELTEVLERNYTPFTPPPQKRISPFELVENAKSIIMCVFNYYTGEHSANVSKYVYGADYHTVVREKLEALCRMTEETVGEFEHFIFCDTSPLCDKYLAHMSGLGIIGKNHLLIHPKFGSYIFVGGIVTDLELEADMPSEGGCDDCNRCVVCCPGNALDERGNFDAKKCASYIAQKKGTLTDAESEILQKCGSMWGCDVCSDVCPHNKNALITDIKEFFGCEPSVTEEDFADKSAFRKKLGNRAFVWRGYDTLKRNFDITKKK